MRKGAEENWTKTLLESRTEKTAMERTMLAMNSLRKT